MISVIFPSGAFMSISCMFRIRSIVWLNFFCPDFSLACLTASVMVFLSRGIFVPRANEGLECGYKNIRLSVCYCGAGCERLTVDGVPLWAECCLGLVCVFAEGDSYTFALC